MLCKHSGFHEVRSRYDRQAGVIVHVWTCEHCGEELRKAVWAAYRPKYDPEGSERFLADAGVGVRPAAT